MSPDPPKEAPTFTYRFVRERKNASGVLENEAKI